MLGILMLDSRFVRWPGDIGHPATWPFDVRFRVVRGATPDKVVLDAARGLVPAFVEAACELAHEGAEAITTSCGFMALHQRELAAAVPVPMLTSALMQVPWLDATLPRGRRVGVLTASAGSLGPGHLEAVGAAADTPIVGVDRGSEFYRVVVLGERESFDPAAAQREVVRAGRELVERHPEVGAIVLECTNMPPFAAAVHREVGRPVHDIVSLMHWVHCGLRPRGF